MDHRCFADLPRAHHYLDKFPGTFQPLSNYLKISRDGIKIKLKPIL